ncbi:ketopantoate reductase family protein [Salinibacillus xinjiangensis]|uniref:Ketopantoate reductase N-terminal domain-containing protein n=1 Tax=Salinibacillus xinjiangensis TaxID=1229268 RepID=A0A6G1X4M7_9BACI|nr:2-dehydropantoate 2-reductase N-terminal domain-containing protein [Salinibacillus xinjiangensis]MRG85951.1 hypothetical protein [Salinibacillus xinjiangensis]
MKIGIAGAGAVGGLFGGLLHEAGHSVTFLARGSHLEAMEKDVLTVTTDQKIIHVDGVFTNDPRNLADCELVLFCVKSTDTEEILSKNFGGKSSVIMCKLCPNHSRGTRKGSRIWPFYVSDWRA